MQKNKMNYLRLVFTAILFTTITLSAQKRVPDWSKSAVWYQIFPERFCNGDNSNDPTPEDMKGGWPYDIPKGWQISNWEGDWYELQTWEKADGKDFYWNAGTRRYGGDLQGIINKLSYLKNLGINAIYLNPLFESPSLHKYDASMYRHIDNNFGPNPKFDKKIWKSENPINPLTWKWTSADSLFLQLIKEAHKRGIKVIIDGVFNHVGKTFWAFQDVVRNQQKSKYKNWFIIKSWDNPNTKENEFQYSGWYGVPDLPEIREDANGLVKGAREHIHNIVKRWGDPNGDGNPEDGIDGWRLDVADMVNINFWKDFRKWVKEINPNAYITGEIWWEDWSKNKIYNASPWLQGDTFDAVMNYRFARAVKRFVADKKLQIVADGFIDSLYNQYRDYNHENLLALMNMMDSHDTERLASIIVNPDHLYDHYANPQQNSDWLVRKPNDLERKKQKLMVALQMTLPGAPVVYYGDEAGMWGGDDPDDRKPMVWAEMKFSDETHHPFGKYRERDKVQFDSALFNYYSKLINIRKSNKALSIGDISFIKMKDEPFVLAFKRKLNEDSLIVVSNNSNKSVDVSFSVSNRKSSFVDLISNNRFELKNNLIILILKPYQTIILK